ncbi:Uncharacterized protein FWK35_00029770, partial [Aphis craccivora]
LSTLRKWSSNFPIKTGVLDGVMAIMEKKGASMDEKDKITALSFDEVYIAHDIFFTALLKKLLVHTKSFSHDNPSFSHPITGRAVHVFADVPYLIKLLRNHFIDHGFLLDKKSLMRLSQSGDLMLTFKLTELHLRAKGHQRQKVRLTTQLFSHTVAKAFQYYGDKNALLPSNWEKCAEIIILVNNWFDLLNSQQPYGDNLNAYGLEIDEQNKLLDEMDNFIKTMLVHSIKSFIHFKRKFWEWVVLIHILIHWNSKENKDAECLLNACDMTEESNKLLDKESVFVGDVFNEAEIYFTQDNKIEASTITLHSDNRSININLNANNKDLELLNAFDLEMNELYPDNPWKMENLQYIAGSIAYKYRNKYPVLSNQIETNDSNDWTDYISKVQNEIPDNSVPDEVLACMIRTRTYIRIRELNRAKQQKTVKPNYKNSKIKKIVM